MSKKIEPKEALRVLKNNIHYSSYELNEATKNDTNSRLIRSIRTLDELVDKATSKGVVGLSITHDGLVGNCPNCRKFVRQQDSKPNVCECTQMLDWSKDE